MESQRCNSHRGGNCLWGAERIQGSKNSTFDNNISLFHLFSLTGWAHCRWRHTEFHQGGTVAPGRKSNYDDDGSGKFLKLEDFAGHVLQNLMKRNVLTQFFYTWLAWLWSSGQPWIVYVHGLRWEGWQQQNFGRKGINAHIFTSWSNSILMESGFGILFSTTHIFYHIEMKCCPWGDFSCHNHRI